ncbi:amidohydrolase family protein [Mangrovibrevibacter kandeliae]|uniref:amidohydrolase family protein n=1 Tax=Mangrovibrevibacter kandeliae TaxID=2968473 RepID=UPI002118BB4C|nr:MULTISPECIES: amidohydrolase family protein [unclassified Aurantimonas]MCQ8781567.1 amidohydrolase [Aurantimonas sp. CSK15Z-1]MCW4114341.1 amidohydrolase [Aurantimonas sp. MSK8Z-1]
MPRRIIDIHPHVIASDTARYPMAPLGGHQSNWSAERPVSWQQLLADMKEAGVDQAAIVQASTCYGYDNSYVTDAVAAAPDRFTAVGSVDALSDDAVERIRYWQSRGMTGLRLFTTGSTMPGQATWFTDPRTAPVWTYAQETGLPVCMQMTQDGLTDLEEILGRFPGVKIVLDHLARPDLSGGEAFPQAQKLFDFARYPAVYLKLTVRAFEALKAAGARPEPFFERLIAAYGANRIAWGSNHPASAGGLKALLETAQDGLSFLPSDTLDQIFAGTALALYPALAEAGGKREVAARD